MGTRKHVVIILSVFLLSIFAPISSFAADASEEFKAAHGDFNALFVRDKSNLKFGYLAQPENEMEDSTTEFDLHNFFINARTSFIRSKDLFFNLGLDYDARYYDFRNVRPPLQTDSETLHKVALDLGVGYFYSPDLLLLGSFKPGIYSDFDEDLNSDDYNFFGQAMVVYRLNPRLQILGGLAVTEDFEDTAVIPLIGARWEGEDKRWRLDVTLPKEIRLGYNITPKAQAYVGAWISGNQYSVRVESAQNAQVDFQVQDRRAGIGLVYNFTEKTWLTVEAGVSSGSEFEIKTSTGREATGDIDDAGYVSVTLSFRL